MRGFSCRKPSAGLERLPGRPTGFSRSCGSLRCYDACRDDMRICCILHTFPRACANTCLFTSHSRARVWQVFDGRELAPRLPLRLPRARMTSFRRSKDICARERSVLAGRRRALAMSLGLPVAVYPAVAPSLSALYSFSSSSKIATNRFVRNGSCWMLSAVAAISSIAFSQ